MLGLILAACLAQAPECHCPPALHLPAAQERIQLIRWQLPPGEWERLALTQHGWQEAVSVIELCPQYWPEPPDAPNGGPFPPPPWPKSPPLIGEYTYDAYNPMLDRWTPKVKDY